MATMPKRPHILIFNPDQWRGDVMGHLGHPAAVTPNLDAAAGGDFVSFRNAFCQNPVCTPSRCAFMSGWYPHVRGHRTMYHMMRPDEPVLLRTLKESGYFVWWCGKNDLVPGQDGYEAFCHVRHQPADVVRPDPHTRHAWRGQPGSDTYYSFYVGRLDHDPAAGVYRDHGWACVLDTCEHIGRCPKDAPVCWYVPIGPPHPPYAVEEPYYSMIDRSKVPPRTPTPEGWRGKPSMLRGICQRQGMQGWSEDRWTELRATYYGMCAKVDAMFGHLVAALRDAGVYDDTAVLFFSDHGDFTGDYGLVEKNQNTFEDCLVRVPLLVKPPAGVPCRPGVREALVELIDVPATVEALTGVAPRHDHFGRSLLGLLAAEGPFRDAVFCEGGRRHGERQAMELDSSSSQVPEGLYWPRVNLQSCDDGPWHTKAAMCRTGRYKYVRRLYETDELYDLASDPRELDNRIDDPAMAAVAGEMKDRLLTWYQETCDVVPRETDRRE